MPANIYKTFQAGTRTAHRASEAGRALQSSFQGNSSKSGRCTPRLSVSSSGEGPAPHTWSSRLGASGIPRNSEKDSKVLREGSRRLRRHRQQSRTRNILTVSFIHVATFLRLSTDGQCGRLAYALSCIRTNYAPCWGPQQRCQQRPRLLAYTPPRSRWLASEVADRIRAGVAWACRIASPRGHLGESSPLPTLLAAAGPPNLSQRPPWQRQSRRKGTRLCSLIG